MQTTLAIGRLTYKVSTTTAKNGETVYLLEGKRGALYATMRNARTPSRMFLIGAGKTFSGPFGKKTVWLTDASGSLEVLP
jgi:hypothetical protein